MHAPEIPSLPRALPGGLVLDYARNEEDLQQVLAAHVAAFGPEEEVALRENLCHRPWQRPGVAFLVRDPERGLVASSVSLHDVVWLYEGLRVPVAEVGIVSTRPEYRDRGLVREQFAEYHRLARRRGAALSVIMGIAHFYRQFGYEYAPPLHGGATLPLARIPEASEAEAAAGWQVRRATDGDWPFLLEAYARHVAGFGVACELPEAIWRYQDALPPESDDARITYVVERAGEPRGFIRVAPAVDRSARGGLRVDSAYLPERPMALAALRWAKGVSEAEHGGRDLRIFTGPYCALVQTALDLGGTPRRAYAWQVRIMDPVRLMMAIAPALEARVAASPFRGLTEDVALRLIPENVVLRFREGRLLGVSTPRVAKTRALLLPPHAAPLLFLGVRSIHEILDWYPDADTRDGTVTRLIDVLFPKRTSWVCSTF